MRLQRTILTRARRGDRTRLWRDLLIGVTTIVVLLGSAAFAEPAGQVRRVGVLIDTFDADDAVFRDALAELGWVDGRNLILEYRFAEHRHQQLPALAADLVRLGVDVIVAPASVYTEAARRATSTIPIVFYSHGDPVGAGHVASLAHPGGNVTGTAALQTEINSKALEILTEVLPGRRRIAGLWNPTNPGNRLSRPAVDQAARTLGVDLRWQSATTVEELEPAFAAMSREGAEAIFVLQSPLIIGNRARVAELALQHRLPGMLGWRETAEAGGLMSYAPDLQDMARRAAVFVDKILKGAKPADLPVEQASTYDLVINLKTARALGIEIPPEILARADEIIE